MRRPWVIAGAIVALFVVACVSVLAYLGTRYRSYSTPSGAMAPTLNVGDAFFVDRFAYWGSAPQRGDVVVFVPPIASPSVFLKRIVAVPGDRFAIHGGRAVLNGTVLREPYIAEPARYELAIRDYRLWVDGAPLDPATALLPPRADWTAPDTVPKDCYVALGDNRNDSEDTHMWGFVCPGLRGPTAQKPVEIIGRASLPPYARIR
ncbi:MAG TPA: signal peptidase I [Candidatus Elarobacter sp.]|jgi:signal peptidase I|nr:signal peptidase I [Candidatus Elarobacter sp.]